ncbi:CBS domain-containing protein [Cohnella lupini]|uniref:CBS domain protein n=1 Tax=Cohnella lupini TaxID=1294267 RepID=A0A3D9IIW7_9BACL|nr:CBS domain-containing protein [Cohnella lupini]RED61682.1 CBS domain protein [Cohnella lupini]
MRKISDIMSTDCITVSPQSNINEAAKMMRDHDIGFLPVIDGGKLIGVVTDRDLVVRGYANDQSGSSSVKEVLSGNVRSISRNMSIDEAASLMSAEQIRRLPVVENGELIGILSIGDLATRDIFVSEAGEALSQISEQDGSQSNFAH